jgi:hypothetical protein
VIEGNGALKETGCVVGGGTYLSRREEDCTASDAALTICQFQAM